MSDYTPVTSDMSAFSATVGATAVTGGQLVDTGAADGTVIPALGVKRPVGVAAHDAATGQRVTVYVLPGMIHEVLVKSGSTLAIGNPVIPGTAAGTIDTGTLATVAAAGTLIGVCIKGSGGAGDGTTIKARFVGL
jgi:hypothetical protein